MDGRGVMVCDVEGRWVGARVCVFVSVSLAGCVSFFLLWAIRYGWIRLVGGKVVEGGGESGREM